MGDDVRLQEEVAHELAWDPSIDAAHIGVTARNGVVTLSGHVESLPQKLAAEAAAARVRGVHAIAQALVVRLPADKKTSDEEIAGRALKILEWTDPTVAPRLRIQVENGIVSLSGAVDWEYQRRDAARAVHRLGGVKRIDNAITVRVQPAVPQVREAILRALGRHAAIEAAGVSVVVTSGSTVVLNGKVHSLAERDLIEQAVWSAPGVAIVESHIAVDPLGSIG
jgi:osmotically-inducible protein OsmY